MNEVERQIQFEKECRELWRAVFAAVVSGITTGITTWTRENPNSWADAAVKDYRERFQPNEK